MQMQQVDIQTIDEEPLFFTPKKRSTRTRKWREIEAIKAQQRLTKELQEIDQSFAFSLADIV